ncbi:MAG: VOC family protein [Actinomycetota bacterium]|nr:VOC family protein [Actinomycetota bacterium]
MVEIAALVVGDPPQLWRELGFVVDGDACWVSGVRHQLGASGEGVTAWALRPDPLLPPTGIPVTELPLADGPLADVSSTAAEATPAHPNGVIALDHVVVFTPDLARTIDAFEVAGIRLRRTRDAGTKDRPMTQAFFRLGATILEVVGPPTTMKPSPSTPSMSTPSTSPPSASGRGPARFFGLAFTVEDLDATATLLGARLRPPQDAVQPGRRIATVDRAAGSSVPIAFMSP